MPISLTEEENKFVAAAKGNGSITEAMVEEALKERESGGESARIPDIFVKKGFLTSEQATTLLREAQKPPEKAKPSPTKLCSGLRTFCLCPSEGARSAMKRSWD